MGLLINFALPDSAPAGVSDEARMAALVRYAETTLVHGRDTSVSYTHLTLPTKRIV